MNPNARPSERAAQQEIRQSERPKRALGQVANAGASLAGIAGGSALISRILPLLSKLIPSDMAAKGLAKVSPRLEKFFRGITSTGYTIDDGLDHLRSQFTPNDSEPEKQPQQGSEGLNNFISDLQSRLDSNYPQEKQQNQPMQQSPQQNQQQPQQQQNENTDAALLAALDKILKM